MSPSPPAGPHARFGMPGCDNRANVYGDRARRHRRGFSSAQRKGCRAVGGGDGAPRSDPAASLGPFAAADPERIGTCDPCTGVPWTAPAGSHQRLHRTPGPGIAVGTAAFGAKGPEPGVGRRRPTSARERLPGLPAHVRPQQRRRRRPHYQRLRALGPS
jgi:hypothetical protein